MAGIRFSERREERRGKGKNWSGGGRYLRAKTGGQRGAFWSFKGVAFESGGTSGGPVVVGPGGVRCL